MENSKRPDIEILIASVDHNSSIIELDNYVCELAQWGDEIEKLSDPQKNFFFNQNLEREINNGGFDQFFFNSSGDFAHDTVNSLDAIGAKATVALLIRAIDEFPDGNVPNDTSERRRLMLELWPVSPNKVWEQLDQKFYAYEDDLNALNMAYVTANRESF